MSELDTEEKPIVRSRWVKKSKVERYTKEQRKYLDSNFPREEAGWYRGARVGKA